MPIAASKKCQSFINVIADEVETLQAIAARLEACRTAFQSQGVDAAGTPLDGHLPSVSTWIDAVAASANSAVATGFIAHRIPTHTARALED